jgi:hypothetical protein
VNLPIDLISLTLAVQMLQENLSMVATDLIIFFV